MILTRSPLRITLGGGGTDLPSYYRDYGGFLVAAAIDKYVYVSIGTNDGYVTTPYEKNEVKTLDSLITLKYPKAYKIVCPGTIGWGNVTNATKTKQKTNNFCLFVYIF